MWCEWSDDLQLQPGEKFLAKLHLIPKKTDELLQRLNKNSESFIQAEEEALLTLNWHCVGEKAK